MPLKELLSADAIRSAHDGAGPARYMRQHPGTDRFVVAGEIELVDSLAVAGVRPQSLVGMRDANAHDGPLSHRFGCLDGDFPRGLVLAQSFEGGLANVTVRGPACKLDLSHECRLHPMNARRRAGRARCAERIFPAVRGFELRQQRAHFLAAESSPDAPDVSELAAAAHARQQ